MLKGKKINNTEYEIWGYLYKELSRLNSILVIYDKIAVNVNINNNNYNHFFQMVLDSLTRTICLILSTFFDSRNGTWSLYEFDCLKKTEIDKLNEYSKDFLLIRHNRIGHISQYYNHKDNFIILTKKAIEKCKEISKGNDNLKGLDTLLDEISTSKNYKEGYIAEFRQIDFACENLILDLKKKFN